MLQNLLPLVKEHPNNLLIFTSPETTESVTKLNTYPGSLPYLHLMQHVHHVT